MKQIYSARDEIDAEMVKNALADAEIVSVVQGGGLGGILGAIPVTEGSLPSVWVREEDAARAAQVLADFHRPPTPAGTNWTCPACGQVIAPQFTACWNCGKEQNDAIVYS